ncbi:hypothetical protein ACWEN3_32460 [Streptomyces sp. NPDC004561]
MGGERADDAGNGGENGAVANGGVQHLLLSARFAVESDRNHQLVFGDNAPAGLLNLLTGQGPTE